MNIAAEVWRRAYRAACRHDGMPEDTKFAVFSKENPFRPFVDIAAGEFFARKREYDAGGYVGLEMRTATAGMKRPAPGGQGAKPLSPQLSLDDYAVMR